MGEINPKLTEIIEQFLGTSDENISITSIESGHINSTFQVRTSTQTYILQKINTSIFRNPIALVENGQLVREFLLAQQYPHPILESKKTINQQWLVENEWRLFVKIQHSKTFEKVQSEKQAFEAAKFLGEFHAYLNHFPTEKIKETLPGFLDFENRLKSFDTAVEKANLDRKNISKTLINFINQYRDWVKSWTDVIAQLPTRILHADPKISNFLFDEKNTSLPIALIDWDTLITGPILYDFGDMVRSYTNEKEEDDASESSNNFSVSYFENLKKGFLNSFENQLMATEIAQLDFGAKMIIYIQCMRFLTDFLNNDVYFRIHYSTQNLDRAKNQMHLLQDLMTYLPT